MQLRKAAVLTFSIILFSLFSFSQTIRNTEYHHFSKEDISDFLMAKSKSQKTKGIAALIAGPLLSGIGLYMFYQEKEIPVTLFPSGSWVSYSPKRTIGGMAGCLGIFTTFSSVPLLIIANNTKKEARLILSDHSANLPGKRLSLPGVGMQVVF